jgi:hypothetical protein
MDARAVWRTTHTLDVHSTAVEEDLTVSDNDAGRGVARNVNAVPHEMPNLAFMHEDRPAPGDFDPIDASTETLKIETLQYDYISRSGGHIDSIYAGCEHACFDAIRNNADEFGGQTDGLRRVVSDRAVFDRDLGLHFQLLSESKLSIC